MVIRKSGRSSDFITPSFGYGCLLNCSYCYMKRHLSDGLSVATNIGDILTAINNHVAWLPIKEANQTDPVYWTYDFSCNEDFALHAKYYDWRYIFDFFKKHPSAKGTIATKIIPNVFLDYNPTKKIRIRFSLMPQELSTILEPNTPLIRDRIRAINVFSQAGYEVHVNFSPVIVYDGWLEGYKKLFEELDRVVINKEETKAEVIFMTHNEKKHHENLKHKIKGESYLWQPHLQETKTSEYGGKNIRYKAGFKEEFISQFKDLHDEVIPWNLIRYIF